MKIENGIVSMKDEEVEVLKFSEQAIMSLVMIVQKTFLDIAQDKGDKSIGDYLEESELILKNGEIFINNPVSFSIDKEWEDEDFDEDDTDEDTEDDEEKDEEAMLIRTSLQYRN
jgi:ATP-dependent exoDNAse (exonuclease V) beta subunit